MWILRASHRAVWRGLSRLLLALMGKHMRQTWYVPELFVSPVIEFSDQWSSKDGGVPEAYCPHSSGAHVSQSDTVNTETGCSSRASPTSSCGGVMSNNPQNGSGGLSHEAPIPISLVPALLQCCNRQASVFTLHPRRRCLVPPMPPRHPFL